MIQPTTALLLLNSSKTWKTHTVSVDESSMRLDRWLKSTCPHWPLAYLHKMLRKGAVRVNGGRASAATRLESGQVIRLPCDASQANLNRPLLKPAPQNPSSPFPHSVALSQISCVQKQGQPLKKMILWEDKDILILNKPYGLAVQGGSGLSYHLEQLLEEEGNYKEKLRLVHRLDRETSGLLILAKNRKSAADLSEAFRMRKVEKTYWALVEGVPRPSTGRISLFLAKTKSCASPAPVSKRHSGSSFPSVGKGAVKRPVYDIEKMRVVEHGAEEAQHSVTHYALVEKAGKAFSWLSLMPVTGRTHQLRAHAQAIHHPIVGDQKYGAAQDLPYQMGSLQAGSVERIENKLHLLARRILFPHPRGEIIDVTAPLPPHMQHSWSMFGFEIP